MMLRAGGVIVGYLHHTPLGNFGQVVRPAPHTQATKTKGGGNVIRSGSQVGRDDDGRRSVAFARDGRSLGAPGARVSDPTEDRVSSCAVVPARTQPARRAYLRRGPDNWRMP